MPKLENIHTEKITTATTMTKYSGDGGGRRRYWLGSVSVSRWCVKMMLLLQTLLLLITTTPDLTQAHPDDLRLVNNGYEGLVVSFTEYVPQEHCNDVIHGLKVRFINTELLLLLLDIL